MPTYFIKVDGNDANTGLSDAQAWAFSRLDTFVPANGDVILFKRGQEYFGSLILKKSGASGAAITYGAYDVGSAPIISTLKTLSGWVNHSGNVWKVAAGIPANCGIVTLNDAPVEIGHWPAIGFAVWDSNVGITSITDAALPTNPNFTGAELVLYKSNWTIDRSLITNHSNQTITYTSGSAWAMQTSGGQKYLIQKHLSCLTYHGAWYCDGAFFYMYLDSAPTNYVIKAGSADFTISMDRKNYNIIQDIEIQGGNLYSHYCLSSTYHQLLRCKIKNTGLTGITIITNGVTGASTNTKISECNISKTGGSGIWLNSAGSSIDKNVVDHCGDFAGMGDPGGGSHYGIYSKGVANIVEDNRVTNTGYIPIYWESSSARTRRNFVANYPTLGLNDGGGIYTFASVDNIDMQCYDNIVMDSTANGLYSDGAANHVEFYGNTVINIAKWGIHMNEPVGNNVHNNTFYNCALAGIDITNQYYNGVVASGNDVNNNIVVQGNATQVLVSLQDHNTNNAIMNLGTMNNNKFIVSESAANVFFNQKGSAGSPPFSAVYRNFTDWKAFTGKETNSQLVTKDLTKLSIHYNDTLVEKIIPLGSPKKDLDGTIYTNTITLQPFVSKVLEDYSDDISFQVDSYGKYLVDNFGKY